MKSFIFTMQHVDDSMIRERFLLIMVGSAEVVDTSRRASTKQAGIFLRSRQD